MARKAEPILPLTLLLLAGGEGRRMGGPKSLLRLPGGETLLEWTVRRLGPSFAETLIAAARLEQIPLALHGLAVLDEHEDGGPLAGIEAGLKASGQSAAFALACDLPHVDADLAAALLERLPGRQAVVPTLDGRPQPTAAIYHRSALPDIAAALAGRRLALKELLGRLRLELVPRADARTFSNLNSPEEYSAFLDNWR